MFRRILCILTVLTLIPIAALSSGLEFAQMTDEQLVEIDGLLAEEMVSRGLYVFVSKSGSKYHDDPDCSQMKASMSVPVDDAEACGYEPCKKCFK